MMTDSTRTGLSRSFSLSLSLSLFLFLPDSYSYPTGSATQYCEGIHLLHTFMLDCFLDYLFATQGFQYFQIAFQIAFQLALLFLLMSDFLDQAAPN
jgi:hypothetical protein